MSALDKYAGPGTIYLGANALAEATSVSWDLNANNRRVYTMKKGLAGRSEGPREMEITVENAVPISGLEQEYVEKCRDGADVRIVVALAGQQYQVNGWIDRVSGSQSTDASASLSFMVVGGPPDIL